MKTKDKDSVEIQLTTDGERYYSFAGFRNSEDTVKNKKVRANVTGSKMKRSYMLSGRMNGKLRTFLLLMFLHSLARNLKLTDIQCQVKNLFLSTELIIFDVDTRSRVNVDLKKWKDQTIDVAWSSQEEADKLILIRKDRPLKNLDVCLVNAETGAVSVLFSEKTWPYFNNEYTRLSVLKRGQRYNMVVGKDRLGPALSV